MMNRFSLLTLLFLLTLGVFAPLAQAQGTEADVCALLVERDREIKTLLGDSETITEAQREELRALVNDGIDFAAMSQLVLGRHWDDLTDAQRADFVEVFGDVVRAQSLANLDAYRAEVTYETITVDGDAARVVTTALYKDTPATVEYVLGFDDGQWWMHDIILDEVSTAEGYARSFRRVILKKGFDSLMTSLRKKRDEVTQSS